MAMPISEDKVLTWPGDLLLSLLNQQLRDEFKSLEGLARYHDLSLTVLQKRLSELNLNYDPVTNQIKG
ncbi:DUF4250 family protein [Reinekea blandensis]|uniref:DUF4250 domain-containing protein n=1 Tax=Reinekea blandensis MED297 TaxID=314283 RepID=A4BBC2_9GAMM|nr:DUF4250 family protein [Reinekea blandensis]EAR10735.1 hypothetical protein MED297_11985 [Reinekea sp. MED297] [Reinekea blandensis MED297]